MTFQIGAKRCGHRPQLFPEISLGIYVSCEIGVEAEILVPERYNTASN